MTRLERAGMAKCAPKMNPKSDPNKWLSDEHGSMEKTGQREVQGKTMISAMLDA